MNILANMMFKIPPGATNYKGEMTFTFPEDALVLSFMPHMHLRGVSAQYVVTYADGATETLLSVPDYDFGWQSVYRFEKPLHIPKGSKLTWIGRWDNSKDNPRNPDPTKAVQWGLQTWDEMQNGWMEVVWKKRQSQPDTTSWNMCPSQGLPTGSLNETVPAARSREGSQGLAWPDLHGRPLRLASAAGVRADR
jgi:hypothetical protein